MLARWQATITDENGDIVPEATVTVRLEASGSLVQLYSDRDGENTIGNPTQADEDGFIAFHVPGGAYRIDASSGAFSRTWRYVGIALSQEIDPSAGMGALLRTDGDGSGLTGIEQVVLADVHVFTTANDGTDAWTKPSGLDHVLVHVVGAGGGGGGTAATNGLAGGGGGGGGLRLQED